MRGCCFAFVALSSAACFHQNVNTGLAPSTTVVDKPWVSTWLWGLVAAQPIDVRQQCPRGTALIETEQSFANGLVSVVTLGIYTPQHVRVTCAERSASLPRGAFEMSIPANASAADRRALVDSAVERTLETEAPTIIHF